MIWSIIMRAIKGRPEDQVQMAPQPARGRNETVHVLMDRNRALKANEAAAQRASDILEKMIKAGGGNHQWHSSP